MSGGTPVTQVRNTELIDILSTDFIRRNEATVAWGKACGIFQMLPGLRGFWPMSSVDNAGATYDLSGQGRTLAVGGSPDVQAVGITPHMNYYGADYHSRADEAGLDIVGTEAYTEPTFRGLTLGGWFYLTSLAPGHQYGLISKWNNTGNQLSYILYWDDTTNCPFFAVTTDGATPVQVQGDALSVNTWYFIVGRFDPSTELAAFVNGSKDTNVVGVPATIHSGTANLNIGAYDNGATGLLHGRASLCFLTASALTDTIIKSLYYHTRSLFGYV